MSHAHVPTDEQRNQVAIAAGGGMSHEDIAIGLGIDRKTLDKHYERELSEGAFLKRMEVVGALHACALKGNATAARTYLDKAPELAVPPAEKPGDGSKPKLGKKDQADEDAKTAADGSDWGGILKAVPGGRK